LTRYLLPIKSPRPRAVSVWYRRAMPTKNQLKRLFTENRAKQLFLEDNWTSYFCCLTTSIRHHCLRHASRVGERIFVDQKIILLGDPWRVAEPGPYQL